VKSWVYGTFKLIRVTKFESVAAKSQMYNIRFCFAPDRKDGSLILIINGK